MNNEKNNKKISASEYSLWFFLILGGLLISNAIMFGVGIVALEVKDNQFLNIFFTVISVWGTFVTYNNLKK